MILLAGFLLGLIVGSFLNVVILRLPLTLSGNPININQPKRSFCPQCNHTLSVFEIIPIISFCWQKARCRHCNHKISWQYPAVELATGILTAGLIFSLGFSVQTGFYLLLLWFLLALFVIDATKQLLPDVLTLPLLWLGLIFHIVDSNNISTNDGIIGAVAGYLLLWSVFWLFKLVRKKEAMGYGDFKLNAALGAWFGWQMLPQLLMVAALLGIGFFLIKGYKAEQKLAFGSFLSLSALLLFILQKIV